MGIIYPFAVLGFSSLLGWSGFDDIAAPLILSWFVLLLGVFVAFQVWRSIWTQESIKRLLSTALFLIVCCTVIYVSLWAIAFSAIASCKGCSD